MIYQDRASETDELGLIGQSVIRTATFEGAILSLPPDATHPGGTHYGAGFFLLPQLQDPITTAPILSGQVVLDAAP